jgi:hypothetical protein
MSSLLVTSNCAFSQSEKVIHIFLKTMPNSKLFPSDTSYMPNAMAVRPMLTQRLYNDFNGHDIYMLPGGMACLVPDSSKDLKLLRYGQKNQFWRKPDQQQP